jgi:hypothetical protein
MQPKPALRSRLVGILSGERAAKHLRNRRQALRLDGEVVTNLDAPAPAGPRIVMRARSDDHDRRGRRSIGLLMPRRSIPTSDRPVRRLRSPREGDGGARSVALNSVALKSVALKSGRRRTKRADVPGPVRTSRIAAR